MANCPNCSAEIDSNARFCPDCGQDLKDAGATGAPESTMLTMGGLETLADTQTQGGGRAAIPTLEPGIIFADRYEIGDIVGRGGMGVVYRAKDNMSGKTIALKLIRPERLAGANAVKKLISEGLTARDIRHPNIVSVYDVGEAGGQPFVSMEYLEGQSLRAWHRDMVQKREDVPLRVAARIIAEILDGLKAAHDAGVIHRDLKPENIVMIGDPTDAAAPLKILDFGIARATSGALESGTGTGLGTPRYMAPEQITNADSAGPAADLYSVSVMFYELLVDVLPQGHWQPPSGGRSDVPQGIDALIEKGLSNRPSARPQSAKVYRKALVDAVNLSTPRKFKPAVGPKRDTPASNNPALLKWIGIGVAGFVGLIVLIAALSEFGNTSGSTTGGTTGGTSTNTSRNDYRQLAGTWYSSTGSILQVETDAGGYAVGEGLAPNGEAVDFIAEFSGSAGQYQLISQMSGQEQSGRLTIIDTRHIRYSGPGGQQACFHINHADRKAC